MIIVRSPHRISLAGGGTDLPDFYTNNQFGAVCSFAINRYVYVTINNLADYFPHRLRIAYSQTELTQDVQSIKHPIVREAMKLKKLSGGIDINVMSDIPAGTGMGSSSSFTVCLLHAFNAFQNQLVSKEKIADEACRLEIEMLKEPIGKQDQYAAAFGGIHLYKFNSDGTTFVEPIPMSSENKKNLIDHFMLFYLGGNRASNSILKEQNLNTNKNTEALLEMRAQAIEVAQILTSKPPYDSLGKLLKKGWDLKKTLAGGISNSDVDVAMQTAIDHGAIGGKLLGAGGTGFLLCYVKPENQASVRKALHMYKEIEFDVDPMGSTLLYYGDR